jgi:hypothetical protein
MLERERERERDGFYSFSYSGFKSCFIHFLFDKSRNVELWLLAILQSISRVGVSPLLGFIV